MAYFIAFAKPGFGRVLFFVLSVTVAAALAGCSSGSRALWDAARDSIRSKNPADSATLNPRFQYLRVDTGSHTVLMALGYVDGTADGAGGSVDVWYSASKEVLRLQGGRLASSTGLPVDWRIVQSSPIPAWRTALRNSSGGSYQRVRDVMPGYVTGLKETVTIRPIGAPRSTMARAALPSGVQWFEETAVAEAGQASLPPARFAVDLSGAVERVLYSEQCLSADLCLALQPVVAASSNSAQRPVQE